MVFSTIFDVVRVSDRHRGKGPVDNYRYVVNGKILGKILGLNAWLTLGWPCHLAGANGS